MWGPQQPIRTSSSSKSSGLVTSLECQLTSQHSEPALIGTLAHKQEDRPADASLKVSLISLHRMSRHWYLRWFATSPIVSLVDSKS